MADLGEVKQINKIETHLMTVDEMRESIKSDITTLYKKLNIKNFIQSPANSLDALNFAIRELMIKKYIKPIKKESQRYAESIVK